MQNVSIRKYIKIALSCAFALTAFNTTHGATSLVRRAARGLVSNRVTKTMVKPVSWITQTQFYKKHPWLVKGVGAYLVVTAALYTRGRYYQYVQSKQHAKDKTDFLEIDLQTAARNGQIEQVKKLLKKSYNFEKQNAFFDAAANGHSEIVRLIIESSDARYAIDLNYIPYSIDNYSALHHAVQKNHRTVVQELINAKANLNLKDCQGNTPLMLAVKSAYIDIVSDLIAASAQLDIKNSLGDTALTQVLNSFSDNIPQASRTIMAIALINAGADVNIKNNRGETALMYAAEGKNIAAVQALIKADADLNAQEGTLLSPALHLAADNGNLEITQTLINAGAQLDIQDYIGFTPLHWAADVGHIAIVQALIDAGASLNIPTIDEGRTALHVAASDGMFETASALIRAGADLNIQDNKGATALYDAAHKGHLNIVQALIDADANIDADEINRLENKEAVWKIIAERRQNIATAIDNATDLNPKDISSLIADYLVTPRLQNTPAEGADAPAPVGEQVESKRNHAQAHGDVPGLS